jgi:hypothetical protein
MKIDLLDGKGLVEVDITPKPGELLPCPFCGPREDFPPAFEITNTLQWRVYCRWCDTAYGNHSSSRDRAVLLWNRRLTGGEIE